MQDLSRGSDTIENRLKKVFHREIIEKIEKILVLKPVFFVGAGISHAPPSNLPLFRELNEEIINSATGGMLEKEDYWVLSSSIRPEMVLQILTEALPQKLVHGLLQSLEKIMTTAKPNLNHIFLAEVLRQGGFVFTTNYDNLVEKACKKLNIEIEKRRCYRDQDFDDFRERYLRTRRIPKGYLFKLHGSIEDHESILAILRDVGKDMVGSKREVLEYFLQNFNFFFMGYSCQDDFDIFPVFLDTPSNKDICWFQYAGTEIGEATWGRAVLQYEKGKEETKPLGDKKDWKIINTNELLLKRKNSFKLIGDSSKFVEKELCSSLERKSIGRAVSKSGWMRRAITRWAENISDYHRNLTAGLLFHYVENFNKAVARFKNAENLAQNDKEKAIAQRWLADTYYRKETYREAIQVLTKKTLPIHRERHDYLEIARVYTDIANNFRRLKNFPDALEYAKKAKHLFQDKKEEIISKVGKESYELEYAKCLNIIGLIFYGQRNPSRPLPSLKKALGVCEESLKIRKRWGELGLAAESENAIGLILYEQAKWLGRSDKEKAVELLNEKSLTYLKSALDKKERIGDYRGCQQCFRNLGLNYDLLRDFVPKEDKEKYMGESLRVYEEELNYMKKMLNPPKERFLEVQYRMGELCIQLSKTKEAIELLKEVVKRRDENGDWHNKARALNSLREAYEKTGQKSECKYCCQAIISIYQDVLQNEKMIKEMKDAKIKFENAIKEILPSTSNSLQKMMLTSNVEELAKIIEILKGKLEND